MELTKNIWFALLDYPTQSNSCSNLHLSISKSESCKEKMLENKFKKIKRLSFLGEKVLKVGHYADI